MEGQNNEMNLFEDYNTNEEWWNEVTAFIMANLSSKLSQEATESTASFKEKTDDQMTSMLWQIKDSFDKNDLQVEHSKAITQLITLQRKNCLVDILKIAKLD